MCRIGLVGRRTWTLVGELVDAFGVAVLQVKEQAVAELPAQPSVVVCIQIAGRDIDSRERGVRRLQKVLVHEPGELVRDASPTACDAQFPWSRCIPKRRDSLMSRRKFPRQCR